MSFIRVPLHGILKESEGGYFKILDIRGGSFECSWKTLLVYLFSHKSKTIEDIYQKCQERKINISSPEIEDTFNTLLKNGFLHKVDEEPNEYFDIDTIIRNSQKEYDFYPRMISLAELEISIGEKCPYSCSFCYRGDKQSPHNDKAGEKTLSMKKIQQTIEDASQFGARSISFTGGELSLDPYFYKIVKVIEFAHSLGYKRFIVPTTGFNMSEQKIRKLKELGTTLIISSHASSEKTSFEITGHPGSYNNALQTTKLALEIGVDSSVTMTVDPNNIKEIPKVVNKYMNLGVDFLRVNPVCPVGHGETSMLSRNQMKSIFSKVEVLQNIHGKEKVSCPFDVVEEKNYDDPMICEGGVSRVYVREDGLVSICPYTAHIPEFKVGNIHEKRLKELWPTNEVLKNFRSLTELNDKCYNCRERRYCIDSCWVLAYQVFEGLNLCSEPDCTRFEEGQYEQK
ncbi:MAG: radical SAM protein [Candidatus Aenigmatarchaeota archaeon]